MSNPFKVIGIDPALLRGVSETTARTLVRAVSQALLKVSHPDQEGGDRQRFEAVQTAIQTLKDDAVFASALADFIKSRGDQISVLTTENRKLRQLVRHHETRATAFALAPQSGQLTVRTRAPFHFHVVDFVRSEQKKGHFRPDPSIFMTFEMDEGGQLKIARNGVAQSTGRYLVGTIGSNENITQLMHDCQLDRHDLLLAGQRVRQLSRTGVFTPEPPIGSNRILVKNAGAILRRLRPEITIGSFLFTGLSVEGEDCLYFEGRVYEPPRARSS